MLIQLKLWLQQFTGDPSPADFHRVWRHLEVERHLSKISFDDGSKDYIEKNIEKFKKHPSIIKIKENVKFDETFSFKDSTIDKMYNKLISLDPSKGCMKSDIPTKIIFGTSDIISKPLNSIYNDAKILNNFQHR